MRSHVFQLVGIVSILTICAGKTSAAEEGLSIDRPPEAIETFHCDFGTTWDANYDQWPDRWLREQSVEYPHFLPIKIVEQAPIALGRSLKVDLNGGAAAVHSPRIAVDGLYSYVVECAVKTEGLTHDAAYVTVTLFDAANKPIDTFTSNRVTGTTDWTNVRIPPFSSRAAQVDHAVLTLHLAPTKKRDLHGSAWFADVWMGRLPRMTLTANRRGNIYFDNEKPELLCTASGFAADQTLVIFELLDFQGERLAWEERRLIDPRDKRENAPPDDQPKVFSGSARWQPPIDAPGFYRVRCELPGRSGVANQREVTLAVVRKRSLSQGGEFGWTLPTAEGPLSLVELSDVLGLAGVSWTKFPLWDETSPVEREEQLVSFAERLSMRKIELVGMLSNPPAEVRKHLPTTEAYQSAGIFSAPAETWYPSLEPTITRLSLKVRWWQLGLDNDQSFVGYPDLSKKIAQLKKQFARYGQNLQVGFGWSWLKQAPADNPTWDFLAYSASPPLTWEEQREYLRAPHAANVRRWVVLDPLPADQYPTETRVRDLCMRMLSAKAEGAEGIFIPQVFDTRRGVMNDDGTVGPLFVPWRTTAFLLSGAESLGSMQLELTVPNQVFARGDEMVMALWSDEPVEVRLPLGEKVQSVDLWGRETRLPQRNGQAVLKVGPMPIFLTRLDAAVVRTQLSVRLATARWPSVFGKAHSNALELRNAFPQSISGAVRIQAPSSWRVAPHLSQFKAAPGEWIQLPFEATLPINAGAGRQTVRFDFDLDADHKHQFSVFRHIDVGLDDIFVELTTRLNERGELEVEQRITNQTDDTVDFKCYLMAPLRKRLLLNVQDLGKGVDVRTFRLPRGAELVGQTLRLRAEEVGGNRILNYDVQAEP